VFVQEGGCGGERVWRRDVDVVVGVRRRVPGRVVWVLGWRGHRGDHVRWVVGVIAGVGMGEVCLRRGHRDVHV